MKNISSCKCLTPDWEAIFFHNNTCYFPSQFNAVDSYVPLSYDAVISFAAAYNHILEVTKGPVNGYTLFRTLTKDNFVVSGVTGEIKLKSNGDRNENGKNFTTQCLSYG